MPYASNGGLRLHYHTQPAAAGSPHRTPLLLLHGFMQRSSDWAKVGYVKELAADRELVLLDARGHGDSDKPHAAAQYGMELLVSDVETISN